MKRALVWGMAMAAFGSFGMIFFPTLDPSVAGLAFANAFVPLLNHWRTSGTTRH